MDSPCNFVQERLFFGIFQYLFTSKNENTSPKGNMWWAIPVALLPLTPIHNHGKQGNGYRWPHIALGRLVLILTCFYPWHARFEKAGKKNLWRCPKKVISAQNCMENPFFGVSRPFEGLLETHPNSCWKGLISKCSAKVQQNRKKENCSFQTFFNRIF